MDYILDEDKTTEGIKLLNNAIKLNPNYYIYYSNLADIYIDKGQYDKAIIQYDKAIKPLRETNSTNLDQKEVNKLVAAYNAEKGECYHKLNKKKSFRKL